MLRRLELLQGEIPYVQQLTVADCGAAALATVLGYFGKELALEDIHRAVGVSRDGLSSSAIVEGAHRFGLRGRVVSFDVEALSMVPRATILHWGFTHWVVFDRVTARGVAVVDPAAGRRIVPMPEFRRQFTGVAILFEKGDQFETQARPRWKGVGRYIARLGGQSTAVSRILVLSIFLRVLGLALPLMTGLVVDRVIPRADVGLFQIIAVGVVATVLFNFLATMTRGYLSLQLRTQVDAEMTLDFIDHLVKLPYSYFLLRTPGDLMVRIGANARVRELVTTGVLSSILDGGLACAYLVVLLVGSPVLGLVAFALAAARVAMLLFVRRRYRDLQTQSLEVQSRATSGQMELLGGIETLKAMGAEQQAAERFSNVYVDSLNVGLEQGGLAARFESGLAALEVLSPLVVLACGTLLVLRGNLSLGSMLTLVVLASGFLSPLSSLVSSLTNFQVLGSYLERINEVFDTPREQSLAEVKTAPRLTGRIRLENVSFSYGPAAPEVVKNASIEIAPGEFVAIVGRSGSGKTTLGRLVVGLFRPTSGQVFFDGQPLESLEYRSVRRQVGTVIQRTALFEGSVRRNISLNLEGVSLDEVVAAAKLATIHDDIAALPLAYDTPLASDGGSLSGGQRQKIAIARALVRRPPVLLLDEATSSLDAVSERRVQENLARVSCTRIVIAHRLSTIRDADRIFVMEEGTIVEVGSHAELVAKGGAYARLVAAQLGVSP